MPRQAVTRKTWRLAQGGAYGSEDKPVCVWRLPTDGIEPSERNQMTRQSKWSELSDEVDRLRCAFERGGPFEAGREIVRAFPWEVGEQAIRAFIVGLSPTQIRGVAVALLCLTGETDLRIFGHELQMIADDMPSW